MGGHIKSFLILCLEGPYSLVSTLCRSVGDSGAYRPGFTYLEAPNIESGRYIAIVSTFEPGQMSPFKFTVKSSKHKFDFREVDITQEEKPPSGGTGGSAGGGGGTGGNNGGGGAKV